MVSDNTKLRYIRINILTVWHVIFILVSKYYHMHSIVAFLFVSRRIQTEQELLHGTRTVSVQEYVLRRIYYASLCVKNNVLS